jgi:hypothetical protein
MLHNLAMVAQPENVSEDMLEAYIETTAEADTHLHALLDKETRLEQQLKQVTKRLLLLHKETCTTESSLLQLHIDPADIHEDMVLAALQPSNAIAIPQQSHLSNTNSMDSFFQLHVRFHSIKSETCQHQAGAGDRLISIATPLEQ